MRAEVTCIIPVYNGEKYIEECIESVLNQTHPIREIIVVNDGSEDGTMDVLKQFNSRIRIVDKAHSGISGTLNQGIKYVQTEFIAFIDADDIWATTKTEKQMEAIQRENTDMCFCNMEQFISPELTEEQTKKVSLLVTELKGYSKGSMLARKTVLDKVGIFDTKVKTGDFIDWYSRALSQELTHFLLEETLCRRRIHLSNFMRSENSDIRDYTSILHRHLARKRNR